LERSAFLEDKELSTLRYKDLRRHLLIQDASRDL
jgi:hypothetical protein